MSVIGSVHQTTVVPPVIPPVIQLRTSQASIGKPQKQLMSLTSAPGEATAFETRPTAESASLTVKPNDESIAVDAAQESKHVCWIGEKRSPLQADHQVELLHLQAEADALLIKLQSAESRKMTEVAHR
ncbi:MAG: hypothetical protein AAFS04_18650 [Cyanobacteria bacterium J06631_9]